MSPSRSRSCSRSATEPAQPSLALILLKSILKALPPGGLPQFPILPQARLTNSAIRESDGEVTQPEKLANPEASMATVTLQEPAEAIEAPSAARISFQALRSLASTSPA